MAKKKKGKHAKRNVHAANWEELEEEILALDSIYGDHYEAHEDRRGCSLKIVPHPGEVEANLVSILVEVRYPKGYPSTQVNLKLRNPVGLQTEEVRQLAQELNNSAARYAKAKEVAVFNLAYQCQEYLTELNERAACADPSTSDAQAQSLWHAMQKRQQRSEQLAEVEVEEEEVSTANYLAGMWDFGGGLFDDDADTLMDIATLLPGKPSSRKPIPVERAPSTSQQKDTSGGHKVDGTPHEKEPALQPSTPGGSVGRAARALSDATGSTSVSRRSTTGDITAESSGNGESSSSKSLLENYVTEFARLFRKRSSSGRDLGGVDSLVGMGEGEGSPLEKCKSQMLLAHSLMLLLPGTTGTKAGSTATTLPMLVNHLRESGVLQSWVVWLLEHPTVFDVAFQRLFAKEISLAAQSPDTSETPATSGLLHRFWKRLPLKQTAELQPAEAHPTSRYQSDFQELRRLGRGGFGVVVAAVNRLDGRQYAIKKIRLDAATPSAHGRILREVSTLSRLQHPNIVRYFQAWCEPVEEDDSSDDDDEGEWGVGASGSTTTGSTTSTSTQGNSWMSYSGATVARRPLEKTLTPVKETSREGTVRTDPGTDPMPGTGSDTDGTGTDLESDGSSSDGGSSSGSSDDGGTVYTADAAGRSRDTGEEDEAEKRGKSAESSGGFTFGTGDTSEWHAAMMLESGGGEGRRKFTRSKSKRVTQTLHIQMEFCPRTLSKVLQEGPLEEADRWEVLRGILAGLANIHAQGVIHRDLKPANVFYDAKGEIKIGDFGLAKFHSTDAAQQGGAEGGGVPSDGPMGLTPQPSHPLPSMSEGSGVCGTSWYISPEIANNWASYDEKVDLYSLGVVAFELWHPFSTAMERVALLRELCTPGGPRLPPSWEAANPEAARMVRWLMAASPTNRPTAKEVLASEMLPPLVESEQVAALLRCLPDNPDRYGQVVEAVFAAAHKYTSIASTTGGSLMRPQATPLGIPLHVVAGAPQAFNVKARDRVVRVCKKAFASHGAVGMVSNQVGVVHEHLPPDVVQLLSPQGTRLVLRHELRVPFAAHLANEAAVSGFLDTRQRYEIAWVQRKGVSRGLPTSHLQADLDLIAPVSSNPVDKLLQEAEAIKCFSQIMEAMPEVGHYEIRVNHRHILDAVIASLGIPTDLTPRVLKLLSSAASTSPTCPEARLKAWPGIMAGLTGLNLPPTAVERCRQCVLDLPGTLKERIPRLRDYLLTSYRTPLPPSLSAAQHELEVVEELASQWGVSQPLQLEPLMVGQADYYSGVLLQLHLLQAPLAAADLEHGGKTRVVGVGGRYDKLLKDFWSPAACERAAPPGAVGLTLSVERLVTSLVLAEQKPQGPYSGVPATQAEVLVCGKGARGMLKQRMAVLQLLWAAEVKAVMVPQSDPPLSEQYTYCNVRNIRWMVIVEELRFDTEGVVRVKGLDRKTEENVHTSDLVRYLQAALNGAQDLSRTLSTPTIKNAPSRVTSSADSLHSSLDEEGEMQAPQGGSSSSRVSDGYKQIKEKHVARNR